MVSEIVQLFLPLRMLTFLGTEIQDQRLLEIEFLLGLVKYPRGVHLGTTLVSSPGHGSLVLI